MDELCRWATCHWLRFAQTETPETLDLSLHPRGASCWKLGPDGAAASDGTRTPSNVWCGVALYAEQGDAERAIDDPAAFMPFLARSVESWHALLLPIAHRGECNHLDRDNPGSLLEAQAVDPGGPLVVMTTAGFVLGPQFDMARVVNFRTNVDRVRTVAETSPGNVARQVFAHHTPGDDGVTVSVWRNEDSMIGFAYRAGEHRA